MYTLTEFDYKLIDKYKKSNDEDIALYFFDKYRDDVIEIVFNKINRKFSSIPFEKGDLFHLLWNSIKKSLITFNKKDVFSAVLVNDCYYSTIKEIKKFLNNNEMIMNVSSSYDTIVRNKWKINDKNITTKINLPRNLMIENLINDTYEYVSKYKDTTVKNVVYLKSLGYSIKEICESLNLNRYCVDDIIKTIEKIAKKIYF